MALLAELDALRVPGHPDADPVTGAAHACGHHAQGTAMIGAAAGLTAAGVLNELAGNIVEIKFDMPVIVHTLAHNVAFTRGPVLLARDSRPLGWKDFFSVFFICLLPCALIITQPDLGTTMLLLLILAGMILFHGLKGYVLKTCLLAVPGVGAFMWFVGMHDYQRQRILTFLDPTTDPRGNPLPASTDDDEGHAAAAPEAALAV